MVRLLHVLMNRQQHQVQECFQYGDGSITVQHIFFIDPVQKQATQEKARRCYQKALALYPDDQRPQRVDIPYQNTHIPGYLHMTHQQHAPLVIYINGMDNIKEAEYPELLITTGLNDPRVAYWEPAKFAARLRAMKTDDHVLLLKTNMDAGHAGASGRYDYLKEIAFDYAFLLDRLER